MTTQATTAAATMTGADVSCPICDAPLAGLSAQDADRHVNQCLGDDGGGGGGGANAGNQATSTKGIDSAVAADAAREKRGIFSKHPFAVLCPFANCGRFADAANFYAHCPTAHWDVPLALQRMLACPLCELNGLDGHLWHDDAASLAESSNSLRKTNDDDGDDNDASSSTSSSSSSSSSSSDLVVQVYVQIYARAHTYRFSLKCNQCLTRSDSHR